MFGKYNYVFNKEMDMTSIPLHPILQLSEVDIQEIRKLYDLDVKKINENLDAIEDWLKKQDHLVESLPYMSRDIIERFHILGRGSVERTKITIDKVLTTKGLLPEFILTNPNILSKELQVFLDDLMFITLPIVNPKDHTRVFLWRYSNKHVEDFNIWTLIKLGNFITEMRLRSDYTFSDRYIFDLTYLKLNIITKLNPVLVKRSEVMCTESYGIKVKGFHVINAPPFIDKIIYIFQSVMKEKVASRIYLHKSYEELHEIISKEVLPQEYGGDLPNCRKICENWKSYLNTEEAKEIIEHSSKIVSNETRRSSLKFNEEYLGMPGSFKQLNLD